VLDARLRFIQDTQRGVFSMAELCRRVAVFRRHSSLFCIEVPASGEWNIDVLKLKRQRLVTKNLRA
jgi:hypothetical protein